MGQAIIITDGFHNDTPSTHAQIPVLSSTPSHRHRLRLLRSRSYRCQTAKRTRPPPPFDVCTYVPQPGEGPYFMNGKINDNGEQTCVANGIDFQGINPGEQRKYPITWICNDGYSLDITWFSWCAEDPLYGQMQLVYSTPSGPMPTLMANHVGRGVYKACSWGCEMGDAACTAQQSVT